MINYGDLTKKKNNIKQHDLNWARIPNYAYRILIIGGSESGKASVLLFNLIRQQNS